MMFLIKKIVPIVIVLALLLPDNALKAHDESPAALYIQTYLRLAIYEMENYGIPVSIKLAQGILESSFGSSELALISNNHFGIKCKNYWIGPTYYHPDDDFDRKGNLIDSCFRQYSSVEDSYRDHSIFLRYTSHYSPLFELEITDYRGWARGLQKFGYATNPRYSSMLINIIERYELYRFDEKVLKGEK